MAANRSKFSARPRSQSLPACTVPATSNSNEPEAKTDVDNLSTATANTHQDSTKLSGIILSESAQYMCPLSTGPPSPPSTGCLSKDSGVLSDFYDSSEDEIKDIRVDIDTSARRLSLGTTDWYIYHDSRPRTRIMRRHGRRRRFCRKRMEYRHERGSGGGESTHSKFKMKATRVAVSNQLTYRTRSPHPPVMMTGQSSVACTTSPGSCLDTAPMSRSLTSITGSSLTAPDQTLPAEASLPIFRQTLLPQYYGFTKSLLPKSRSFSEIDEKFNVFETCSSEEQSQHPISQKEVVDESSPPSLEHLHIAGNAGTIFIAKAKASLKIEETKAEVSPNIEETTLSPEPIGRSPHFTKAEKMAGVPFLHHTILECDHHSQEYTIQNHDITFRIPEGAVPTGKKIQFEIAVAMYGPFNFEKDTQPISPILWLCFEEGITVTLNKPFHVILPHYLTGLTYEKAQYHQVVFAKAPHSKYSIEDGQMKYSFQPCDSEPYFASCEGRNFGVLVTNHTCFYCLQANKTPQLAMDAGYCLARIEYLNQRHMEVTFTAVYCLRTCLRAMEEQFPYEEGYRIDYMDFKFKENTEPHVRVVPTCECDKLVVTLIPTSAKIRAGDINFWRKDLDAMQLRHEKKMYPPRVKMTVDMKSPDDHDVYKLSVKIEGCSDEDQLDIQLCFPPSTPSSISGSASSSTSQGECQSPKIKVQERPKLMDVFKELLPLSADWKNIGTLLGLSKGLIDRIAKDEDRARDQLREMLSEWLNQVDPRPTWAALAEAVEPVDKVKAQEIKTRYIDI